MNDEYIRVHFCCEDGSYLDECEWNDLPCNGMYGWLKKNVGYAGDYLCKVYDVYSGTIIREVKVTLP